MEFAICFKGFVQPDRAKALVRLAEALASHIAGSTTATYFGESFAQMAMCMEHTKKCGLDLCNNPNTRDWSLAHQCLAHLLYNQWTI